MSVEEHGQCHEPNCQRHGFHIEQDESGEVFVLFRVRHDGKYHAQRVPARYFAQFANSQTNVTASVTDAK